MRKIKVWTKKPGEPPKQVWISNTLKSLQELAGGYIETVTLMKDFAVICNEEGRIRKLPYNCKIRGIDFVGPIIIVGIYGDDFGNCPLEIDSMGNRRYSRNTAGQNRITKNR